MRCTCTEKRNPDCYRHGDDMEVRTYVIGFDTSVTILTDGALQLTTPYGRERAVIEFKTPRDAMEFSREALEALAWRWTDEELRV